MKTRDHILALLADGVARTVVEVAAALPECNGATVRQKLSTLKTEGILVGAPGEKFSRGRRTGRRTVVYSLAVPK